MGERALDPRGAARLELEQLRHLACHQLAEVDKRHAARDRVRYAAQGRGLADATLTLSHR